jgi:hypothetical protein
MVAQIRKNYFTEDIAPTNHRSSDRIFVLEMLSSAERSKIDTRLVDGNNRIHAVKNPQLPMWHLKLDKGTLPDALQSNFTSFAAAQKCVEQYFLRRGVKVTEVID